MLVLTRKIDESIVFPGLEITVTVVDIVDGVAVLELDIHEQIPVFLAEEPELQLTHSAA